MSYHSWGHDMDEGRGRSIVERWEVLYRLGDAGCNCKCVKDCCYDIARSEVPLMVGVEKEQRDGASSAHLMVGAAVEHPGHGLQRIGKRSSMNGEDFGLVRQQTGRLSAAVVVAKQA